MTTKCYYLDFCPEVSNAIACLYKSSFCLVRKIELAIWGIAITIEARNEDLATVERVLAPYV